MKDGKHLQMCFSIILDDKDIILLCVGTIFNLTKTFAKIAYKYIYIHWPELGMYISLCVCVCVCVCVSVCECKEAFKCGEKFTEVMWTIYQHVIIVDTEVAVVSYHVYIYSQHMTPHTRYIA